MAPCRVMATSTSHLHITPRPYGAQYPWSSFMRACVRRQCARALDARVCVRLRGRITNGSEKEEEESDYTTEGGRGSGDDASGWHKSTLLVIGRARPQPTRPSKGVEGTWHSLTGGLGFRV